MEKQPISFELDESKDIIEATAEQIDFCDLCISNICDAYNTRRYIHDKAIKYFAKKFNLNIENAEKIYQAIRYFEIQP